MLLDYIRSTLGREVNVTGKWIQWALDRRLQQSSTLNSTQAILMMILRCDQVMTLEQVSKDTAAFGKELDDLLQPLLDEGYIAYTTSLDQQAVELTDRGEQLLGQIWTIVEATEDQLLSGFSDEEKQQLAANLKRIQENARQIVET